MKRILAFLVCVLIGVGIGWFLGYTRPVAKNQRELLKQYQYTRDKFHMTDAKMADFGEHLPEYFAAMQRQDEFAAAVALLAFKRLEAGDTNQAERALATTISAYYRGHRLDGNTNLLARIVSYAATNSTMSNAIYRKLE
jgi:thioredoxin-like negative regulator of GroEL